MKAGAGGAICYCGRQVLGLEKDSGGAFEMKGNHFFRLVIAFCLLLFAAECEAVTVTYFPQTNIGGGIQGSATAMITSGSGYLDILLTNTSPLGPDIPPEGIANPFITEIEFKYLDGFTLNEVSSYVSSVGGQLVCAGGRLHGGKLPRKKSIL
jgi:hypothetical protein